MWFMTVSFGSERDLSTPTVGGPAAPPLSVVLPMPARCCRAYREASRGKGLAVGTPVMVGDRDLRTLADIVSKDRADLSAGEGLPPSLLADLMDQIRCDVISFEGFDSRRQKTWLFQSVPGRGDAVAADLDPVHWGHYWDCQPCSYPDRTGDLRSIIKVADFYSARQWHSVGTYCDIYRPQGLEHDLMLTLPPAPGPVTGAGRTMRLFFFRGPGPDFSDRDRAVLTLLRPQPAPGLSRCRAAPPPRSPAHPPADRPAAPGRGRAYQQPDRPSARHIRGNRTYPPGEHLQPAAGLQPHRRGHPRVLRPDGHLGTRRPGHNESQAPSIEWHRLTDR